MNVNRRRFGTCLAGAVGSFAAGPKPAGPRPQTPAPLARAAARLSPAIACHTAPHGSGRRPCYLPSVLVTAVIALVALAQPA